jgi:hypothetical protein
MRSFVVICAVLGATIGSAAVGQNVRPANPPGAAVPSLIRLMVGTWDVEQRMWPAPGAAAIKLPSAVAKRLTPLSGDNAEEFLGMEYVYTRRH